MRTGHQGHSLGKRPVKKPSSWVPVSRSTNMKTTDRTNRKATPRRLRIWISSSALFLLGISLAAAGGGHETGLIEDKISTDTLNGLTLEMVNLYNDNRLLYALVVTLCMAIFGTIIGITTEWLLRLCGLKTTKMEKRE